MVSIFIRNHLRIYEMVIDFIDFLGAFWGTRVNPTLQELKQIMGINKRDDLYLLDNAIKHLKINNYIQMLINENGHEEYL